jgi:hypothetical protein
VGLSGGRTGWIYVGFWGLGSSTIGTIIDYSQEKKLISIHTMCLLLGSVEIARTPAIFEPWAAKIGLHIRI